MKKLYTLYVFVLIVMNSQAQIINFPDANFKAKLLEASASNEIAQNSTGDHFKIDSNIDGEIQVNEAQNVYTLVVSNSTINDLTGIEFFTNISLLDCSNNQVSSLDLTANLFLQNLICNNNSINNVVLPNFIYPIVIDLSFNQLTSINLINLSQIVSLFLNDNQLQSIVFDNPNYTYLIDGGISVSNNPLVNLDMSKLRNSPTVFGEPYDNIDINNTLLTQLICPLAYVKYYYINDNPNLQLISFKNQRLENFVDNDFDTGLFISNNPNLSVVCVDDLSGDSTSELEFFENYFNNPSIVVSTTACNLNVVINENKLTVKIYPNPTNNFLNIVYPEITLINTIAIYNLVGQKLITSTNIQTVDVSSLSKGTYFIKVTTDRGTSNTKFIKE